MNDTQRHRAVANALWPRLQTNTWRRHLVRRDLASTGATVPFRAIGTATIPNTPRTHDQHVITDQHYIRATIWADEWPGGTNLVAELDLDTYADTVRSLPWDTRYDLRIAYQLANCRNPFERSNNRHGTPTLRRNSSDPWITALAAQALEAIAAAADVRTVDQHTVDDALYANEDISPQVVDAILGVRRTGCATL